jgi:hypothetical protein
MREGIKHTPFKLRFPWINVTGNINCNTLSAYDSIRTSAAIASYVLSAYNTGSLSVDNDAVVGDIVVTDKLSATGSLSAFGVSANNWLDVNTYFTVDNAGAVGADSVALVTNLTADNISATGSISTEGLSANSWIATTDLSASDQLVIAGSAHIPYYETSAHNTGVTLTTNDFGNTITVNAAGAQAVTLPSVDQDNIGAWFTVVKMGVGGVALCAADSDIIADSTGGNGIYNNTAAETYATITVQLADSTHWVITGAHGTWVTT